MLDLKRIHPYKIKLFVICHFTLQVHESCKSLEGIEEEQNQDYKKFIEVLEKVCKKYTPTYIQSPNFKRYVELFNFLWDFNMKKIRNDEVLYPMILVFHLLKYCDWDQIRFNEEDDLWVELRDNFKVFDLLVWAREVHKVSNSFCYLKFHQSFKNNYWNN